MTSSVKPEELQNVSQRRQRRTKRRRQAVRKTFGEVRPRGFQVMREDRHTDKQTDILITIPRTPSGSELISVAFAWYLQ